MQKQKEHNVPRTAVRLKTWAHIHLSFYSVVNYTQTLPLTGGKFNYSGEMFLDYARLMWINSLYIIEYYKIM